MGVALLRRDGLVPVFFVGPAFVCFELEVLSSCRHRLSLVHTEVMEVCTMDNGCEFFF